MGKETSICRYIVQARTSGEYDTDILHRKGFDVNMRLFRRSSKYRSIVLDIIQYMGKLAELDFTDYDELSGISGANIGIPLNIIGVRATKDMEPGIVKDTMVFMINPKIVDNSTETRVVKSNCGSLRLPEKVEVERCRWVEVTYLDLTGAEKTVKFDGAMGSTIQHEIEHNLGVLITDREVSEDEVDKK